MALVQVRDREWHRHLTVQSAHIDSTGLGCILRVVRTSAAKGDRVILCRPSSVVRMLLDFSQLKQFAEISNWCDIPGLTDGAAE